MTPASMSSPREVRATQRQEGNCPKRRWSRIWGPSGALHAVSYSSSGADTGNADALSCGNRYGNDTKRRENLLVRADLATPFKKGDLRRCTFITRFRIFDDKRRHDGALLQRAARRWRHRWRRHPTSLGISGPWPRSNIFKGKSIKANPPL